MTLTPSSGGVCAPGGFLASGVKAGIKPSGSPDLALIWSDGAAAVAGTFTTNRAAAAPVVVSRERVERGSGRAVVVNSGCANACTGRQGIDDAREMAAIAARSLQLDNEDVLVCSTGLIGSFLPMERLQAAIPRAAADLGTDDDPAAAAIMTTDTRPKKASVVSSAGWSFGGIAKGAGMISPKMATMLAFLTTDARVEPLDLRAALQDAVSQSFNLITVDGDTSTNDTVLAFANGASGVTPGREELAAALRIVCSDLARQIVADGEGATKTVRVVVRGAASKVEAGNAARTVAESLLVKTALFGQDPNWGRVAAALGRSGASADFGRLSISMAGVALMNKGVPPSSATAAEARKAMAARELTVECDLAVGSGEGEILTTDLSPEYVRFNAEYET
ncbi:MAG: bifunctional glutamate N-acetyltransferase/amino-acid acetyltransferase ArgJ [Actinomycetota bacterium]|nr:bifunctional glutamate N-acetyltransferase/amino-acid acetyltransferase ArgJ [Actinomycetota bacterium]